MMARSGRLDPVTEEECWQLLGTTTVGRLAFSTDTGIEILPLNFIAFDSRIYCRTGADSAMAVLAKGRDDVAFEVDYHDDMNQSGWSVLVKGSTAEAVALDAERAPGQFRTPGPLGTGRPVTRHRSEPKKPQRSEGLHALRRDRPGWSQPSPAAALGRADRI